MPTFAGPGCYEFAAERREFGALQMRRGANLSRVCRQISDREVGIWRGVQRRSLWQGEYERSEYYTLLPTQINPKSPLWLIVDQGGKICTVFS